MVRGGEGDVEGWCEGKRVRRGMVRGGKGEEGITDYSLCHSVILGRLRHRVVAQGDRERRRGPDGSDRIVIEISVSFWKRVQ